MVGGSGAADYTPLWQATHFHRYWRRSFIEQIQKLTKRRLLVYIGVHDHPHGMLTGDDALGIEELLHGMKQEQIDLLLDSPGGDADAAEKLVYLCRERATSFRVIVANAAKSAATLVALGADEIIMGPPSELGPIDPQILVTMGARLVSMPAHSLLESLSIIEQKVAENPSLALVYQPMLAGLSPALLDYCRCAVERARSLAAKLLKRHMLQDREKEADEIAAKLAGAEGRREYLSHGTVIDAKEACILGLKVERLEPDDELWDTVWRLYCACVVAMEEHGWVKLFESDRVTRPRELPAGE